MCGARRRDKGSLDVIDMNMLMAKKCLQRNVVGLSLDRGIEKQSAIGPFGICLLLRHAGDDLVGRLGLVCSSFSRPTTGETRMEAECGNDCA